ncbi:hypothetical protein CORC01_09494 [Colletotrichum orchidophilum]|uniref:Uncharacterized protein n=1 Tax=Colletotrichum orchidophilum TaxID=1209926 RepID=A0A1G4B1L1_9PEZI|nr:uncharacterized protein CORC01_09494 [Colletotrichum orchidophilum]OHE95233.1 hypothetical protein CORC01_09494 [Colletotrichum orchidophilum]
MKSSATLWKFCQPRDNPLALAVPSTQEVPLAPLECHNIDATGLNFGSELYWKWFSLHGAGPAEGQPWTNLTDSDTQQLNSVSSCHARLE